MNSTETKTKVQTFDFSRFGGASMVAVAALFVAVVLFACYSVFSLFADRLNTGAVEAGLAVIASVGVVVVTLGRVLTTNHMPTKGAGAIILIAWIGVTLTLVGLNTALRGGLMAVPDALSGIGQIVAGLLAALALVPVILIPLTMRDATEYESASAAAAKYVGFIAKAVAVLASAIASAYFGMSRGINPMLAAICGLVLETCFVWAYLSLTKANEAQDEFDAWMWRAFCIAYGAFLTVVTVETVSSLAGIRVPIVDVLGEIGESVYVSAIGLSVITAITAHIVASFIDFKDVDGDGKRDWIISGRRIGDKTPKATRTPTLAKDGDAAQVVVKLPAGNPDDLHKLTSRECAHCGKKMKGKGRAKYCSKSCKDKAYRERVEATVEVDGE